MTIFFQKTYQRALGTWPLNGDELRQTIELAAEVGYRAFDTAQMYENEAQTGEALASLGLPRDELCIITKVHPDHFNEKDFLPSVEESLKKLQISDVDVLVLHWPPIGGDIKLSLQLLQGAYERGLARNIGVSNYNSQMMRDAVKIIDAPLVTNQVEFHPLLNQDELLKTACETGIPLSSYCSVARGEIFKHEIFAEIGRAYDKSAAQIALRWIIQKGVSINTMSTKRVNLQSNFNIMDFTLSYVDMKRIDEMTHTNYRIVTPELAPWSPQWN